MALPRIHNASIFFSFVMWLLPLKLLEYYPCVYSDFWTVMKICAGDEQVVVAAIVRYQGSPSCQDCYHFSNIKGGHREKDIFGYRSLEKVKMAACNLQGAVQK